MSRGDFITKWAIYVLAVLPIWWLDLYFLRRWPVFGVAPMLLPLVAAAVGVLEGPMGGAGFGLFVGVLCDAVYYGGRGGMTLGLCLGGWAVGALAQYVLRRSFLSCVVSAALLLAGLDFFRVLWGLFIHLAPLGALLRVAVPEVLWSLVFVVIVYPFFSFVQKRVSHMLRL